MNEVMIQGQATQVGSSASQRICDSVLERMHTHRGHPAAALDRLLFNDPNCLWGHCLRAGLVVRADDTASLSALRTSLDAIDAAELNQDDPARRHAAAARAWLEGDSMLALARYGAIVADRPTDMLALIAAHALDFRMAQWEMLRDRVARVLPSWHVGMPGYASVLAMYAFGLEENGEYRLAQKFARDALAVDPMHVGAIHAMVHVLEMEARAREGLALLADNEAAWSEGNGYLVHLAWHRALFHLELDEVSEALAVYDRKITNAASGEVSALSDASALLWRLELRGFDLRERWQALADRWATQRLALVRPFHVVHAMMAFSAARRKAAASRLLEALHEEAPAALPERKLMRPMCQALAAFARGDFARCVELLAQVRRIAHRCGGSLAQCDLIHLTFTEAALRARESTLARALVAERATRKPTSPLNRLLQNRVRLTTPAMA